jgi:hypothetical protein
MKNCSDHSSILLKSRWHETAYWGLLALAGILFLIMNTLTTLKEDDMAFSLVEGSWVPIHSLLDALRSHCNHFVDANGRTANLVATLFWVIFTGIIYSMSSNNTIFTHGKFLNAHKFLIVVRMCLLIMPLSLQKGRNLCLYTGAIN